jgi:hypothetical protein
MSEKTIKDHGKYVSLKRKGLPKSKAAAEANASVSADHKDKNEGGKGKRNDKSMGGNKSGKQSGAGGRRGGNNKSN